MTPAKHVARMTFAVCVIALGGSPVAQDDKPEQPPDVAKSKAPSAEELQIESEDLPLGPRPSAAVLRLNDSPPWERLTHEIQLSLEERRTLVVWLVDQTMVEAKLKPLQDYLAKMPAELGLVTPDEKSTVVDRAESPLLNSVIAFGNQVTLLTAEPTGDIDELKKAVAKIERDDSGQEKVFSAISMAVNQYRSLTETAADEPEPKRNVILMVITDEPGDDQNLLDETVKLCRQHAIPVFAVGVPAPFGVEHALVKWVDPDPKYDQTPHWAKLELGPESLLPERVKLHFAATPEDPAIDSGFGPFALTRICYETGGIYFAVHPNRVLNRPISEKETESGSAHLQRFLDPNVMRKYRPDYVSQDEYRRLLLKNQARQALVHAAHVSRSFDVNPPRLRFPKTGENAFADALIQAQKEVAKLEPQVEQIHQILRLGEKDRESERSPRWQAGYDLALAQTLATQIRVQQYNAMLAYLKHKSTFRHEGSNTWLLKPAETFSNSGTANKIKLAQSLLQHIVDEHQGTPWAWIAQQELRRPMGWEWTETAAESRSQ